MEIAAVKKIAVIQIYQTSQAPLMCQALCWVISHLSSHLFFTLTLEEYFFFLCASWIFMHMETEAQKSPVPGRRPRDWGLLGSGIFMLTPLHYNFSTSGLLTFWAAVGATVGVVRCSATSLAFTH